MKTTKTIFFIFFLIYLLSTSCKHTENDKPLKRGSSSIEKSIQSALLNGYFAQINNDIGILIYQDNIYYFNTNPNGFENHKFILNLIDEDNSIQNNDFFKDGYEIHDSLKYIFKGVSIIKKKVAIDDFKQIRTGQSVTNSDGQNENLWVFQTNISNIHIRSEFYKNQLSKTLKKNLINEDFLKSLETGIFFKINRGFYMLISDDQLYLIAESTAQLNDKMMLHYVKSDNSFDNHSFIFKSKEYQDFLEKPFNNFKIAKLSIPYNESYKKIRVGQFNENGNVWVQEIVLDDIYTNDLLIYNNELSN